MKPLLLIELIRSLLLQQIGLNRQIEVIKKYLNQELTKKNRIEAIEAIYILSNRLDQVKGDIMNACTFYSPPDRIRPWDEATYIVTHDIKVEIDGKIYVVTAAIPINSTYYSLYPNNKEL